MPAHDISNFLEVIVCSRTASGSERDKESVVLRGGMKQRATQNSRLRNRKPSMEGIVKS
jgi:hypothetical protein